VFQKSNILSFTSRSCFVCVCACVHSHCSEHPWRLRSEVFIPGKKSIFARDDEASQQYAADDGDGASDDDDHADVTATNDNHEQCCMSHSVQHQAAQLVHGSATQLNVRDDVDSVSSSSHDATGDR